MSSNGVHTLLGNLLLNYGVIDQTTLEEALARQEASHEPLGKILVAMGAMSQQELEMVLRAQARLRGRLERNLPHILIVDDDPEVGAVVGEILAGAGYSVGVAQNAQEAMAALSSEDSIPPALIVLDLAMPETSGLELLPKLREVAPPVPVIVLTGHAEMETQVRAIEMGVHEFVLKPAPARRLVGVVDAVLAGTAPLAR